MKNEIKELEKYKVVNEFLRQYDWLFVSPLFFQGYELNYLYELSQQGACDKYRITNLIFSKFYKLEWSASFIEGYCKKCNYIEPFLKSIEHSLILTFQRDYEGGIKTLIPIIEGILRKYLNAEKGIDNSKVKFFHLKEAFTYLKSDLMLEVQSRDSQDHFNEMNEYYEIWFSFVFEFIDKSFYLNTNGSILTNELNRHSILHELGFTFEYNLESYIKVYFVLHFLTWIFLQKEGKGMLNEINQFRYFEKAMAYQSIIKHSEKIAYNKHLLFKDYDGYNPQLLRDKHPIVFETLLPWRMMIKYKILKTYDEFLWKHKFK